VPGALWVVAWNDCDPPCTQFLSPAHHVNAPLSFSLGNSPVCICSSFVGTHCLSLAFAHTCASCSHPLRVFLGRLSWLWEEAGDLVQTLEKFALNLDHFAAAAAAAAAAWHELAPVLLVNLTH